MKKLGGCPGTENNTIYEAILRRDRYRRYNQLSGSVSWLCGEDVREGFI